MEKMPVDKFLAQVKKAVNSKTLYVMGGWGFPLTASNKDRTQSQPYNQRSERKTKIYAASADTFAFDCVGLCKGVLWGWDANADLKNGGAVYGSNGVNDYDAKEMMFSGCSDPTTDFSHIDPGEFLWLDGHCGIYLGDGLAAESTPIWKDGVQITAVSNLGPKTGYNARKWTYHGHLKYVDYAKKTKYPQPPFEASTVREIYYRKTPTKNAPDRVGMINKGATLTIEEVDGEFGKVTGYVLLTSNFKYKSMDGYTVGKEYKVTCSELNIRASASTNAKVVGELKKGAKVTCKALKIDASGNTWMQIKDGWIAAHYNGERYVN